jgi:multidrug resistance efflux pump
MIASNQTVDDFPALQMVRTGRYVRIVARITFWTLIFAIAAMIFVPWRQTARGTGVVVALDPQERPQPVLSPSKGVISYVKPDLREGSYVEKDELLLRMTPFAEEGILQLETQISSLKAKLEAAKNSKEVAEQAVELQLTAGERLAESLQQDLEATARKLEQARDEVDTVSAELADKENLLAIAKESFAIGIEPRETFFSKKQAVEITKAKLSKAENAVAEMESALESKTQQIESKKQDIEIKNQQAKAYVLEAQQKINTIEKELVDLQNKRSEFNRLEVRAPRSGFIQQWFGVAGSDTVKEGDQLFMIVPDATELAVEMKVTGNDIPLIHEGDPVRLQFEGWPAVQFVGWPSVAIGSFGGKVNRVFPTDDGTGYFRVVVTPDNHFAREDGWPDDRYLRQGVRANGWVLLNRVPLGYEIWRQLNGFPPVIADKEPKADKGGKVILPKP